MGRCDILKIFDEEIWIYIIGAIVGIPIEIFFYLNNFWTIWIILGIVGFIIGFAIAVKDSFFFGLFLGLYGLLLGTIFLFLLIGMILNFLYKNRPKNVSKIFSGLFTLSDEKIMKMGTDRLIKILNYPDKHFKNSALSRLTSASKSEEELLGNLWGLKKLGDFLASNNEISQKCKVVKLLGNVGDIRSEDCLCEQYLLNKGVNEQYRQEIQIALEKIGSQKSYKILGNSDNLLTYFRDIQNQINNKVETFNNLTQKRNQPISDFKYIATLEDQNQSEIGTKKFHVALEIAELGKKMANLGYVVEAQTTVRKAQDLANMVSKFDYMLPTETGKWKTIWASPEKNLNNYKSDFNKKIDKIERYLNSLKN